MKRKVFIGLSGGVDSSVSALLLKQCGFDVTGVFIKVWQPDIISCTWKEDRLDAMRVASQLNIPFVTLDLEKEYKEGVIDYMINEYKVGRTPNPDVMCNREIKFGAFLKWVKEQDKNAFIATGHYARVSEVKSQKSKVKSFTLLKSKDKNKDQTYFLWTLTDEQLKHILFPVGNMIKDEVREVARKANLSVSEKKDSQGLCFVGNIDVKTLLKNYIEEKRGNVLNKDGEVIGYHDGIMFYTLGERRGFVITKKCVDGGPYFVVAKDISANTLTVSHTPPYEKKGGTITLEKVNWTKVVKAREIYEARGRYRAGLSKVEILDNSQVKALDEKLLVTPGQSLVLYEGEICIGGGIIS